MTEGGSRQHKAVVVLGTACALLLVLLADAHRGRAPAGSRDRETEADVVARSAEGAAGVWDNHPDADVARVLIPGLEDARQLGYPDTPIDSNHFGMREREYVLPKPPGRLRVVLLGDSYIFGQGVAADQRLGVHLERELRERSGRRPPRLEVLHLGAASWNLLTECAFLRRQLSLMQPDLVIHVSVPNDLDDTTGVRGTGITSRNVPRRPGQTDTVVRQLFAHWELAEGAFGHLALGLDDESRDRFDEAGAAIGRLARGVEALGGRYVHVFHWRMSNPVAARHLASSLRPEQVAWLPTSFYFDERVRLSDSDDHWSPGGHEAMARYCYGLIEDRELLPMAELAPWAEARRTFAVLDRSGREAATGAEALRAWQEKPTVRPVFDIDRLDRRMAAQVHAGIDAEGLVAPYASLLLAHGQENSLRVEGAFLDRPELVGGTLRVSVDGIPVGTVPLEASGRFERSWPLPAAAADRRALTVRFETDDWIYVLPTLRECRSFRIGRVALVDE